MQVIVVGAGMAGLCAAAALRRLDADVVILERDELPDGQAPRRGVPQSNHLHNLLSAAQRGLETLLPRYIESLIEAGGALVRVSADTYVHELGLRMPERDLGLSLVCADRAAVEFVARRMLSSDEGVRLVDRSSVLEISMSGDRVGLTVFDQRSGCQRSLKPALVVDASGAGTRFPRWLRRLGVPLQTEARRIGSWYATALFRAPAPSASPRCWMVFPKPPGRRGGLVSPSAPGTLHASVNGGPGDSPPRTLDEFLRYAATLEDDAIASLLDGCQPLTVPTVFRRPAAVWHHYEHLSDPVPGMVPIGDAFATLDPLLGQGVSVAASQAVALAAARGRVPDLVPAYLSSAAEVARMAWDLSLLATRPPAEQPAWLADERAAHALGELLAEDPALHRAYVSVWHMTEPLSSLDGLGLTTRLQARDTGDAGR